MMVVPASYVQIDAKIKFEIVPISLTTRERFKVKRVAYRNVAAIRRIGLRITAGGIRELKHRMIKSYKKLLGCNKTVTRLTLGKKCPK